MEEKKDLLEKKEDAKETDLDKKAEGIAFGIADKAVKRIEDQLKESEIGKVVSKKELSNTNVKTLSKNEKIVRFFKALVRREGPDYKVIKALSEGVAADGGNLFPNEFRYEIIKDIEEQHRMRSLVKVLPMTRDIIDIPKRGSQVKVYWTAENAAKTTTTADWSQKQLVAYKMAAILYSSEELVDDSTIDVVQEIISQFSEAIATEEDRVITAGSGVAQPTGLTSATITAIACAGNLDFDDINNLFYNLPTQYRNKASFLVHNSNMLEIAKIKDSNGRYLYQDSQAAGDPPTLKGRPVYENNHLPESEIYFGDYKSAYYVGDRQQMTVDISREAGNAWEYDQVSIRVVERIAGNCVLENAVRVLNTIP